MNRYNIVLEVLIVNQTRDTLLACTLELATLGDLKLAILGGSLIIYWKSIISNILFQEPIQVAGPLSWVTRST